MLPTSFDRDDFSVEFLINQIFVFSRKEAKNPGGVTSTSHFQNTVTWSFFDLESSDLSCFIGNWPVFKTTQTAF